MRIMPNKTKKQAEVFTKFYTLGRVAMMRITLRRTIRFYGADRSILNALDNLEELEKFIWNGAEVKQPMIPYREE